MATLRLAAVCAFLGATFGTFGLYLYMYFVVEKEAMTNNADRLFGPTVFPPVFRLGSGARVSGPWPTANANLTSSSFVLTKSAKVKEQHVEGRMLRGGSRKAEASNMGKSVAAWESRKAEPPARYIAVMSPLLCMSIICYMMPGGNPNLSTRSVDMASRDFNYRIPPGWNP